MWLLWSQKIFLQCLCAVLFALSGRDNTAGAKPIATTVKLKPRDIIPPDHIDGSRLESDAHLNRDFSREIFFGEDHDKVTPKTQLEAEKVLKELFPKIDADHDTFLSYSEVAKWISSSITEHLNAAFNSSKVIFSILDSNQDRELSWSEFAVELLVSLGYNRTQASMFMADRSTLGISDEQGQLLSKNHFRWAQADSNNDNKLTLDEFINFHHPELNEAMLSHLVNDMTLNLDRNADGSVSRNEFASVPDGEVETPFPGYPSDPKDEDAEWVKKRRLEFDKYIDINKDGKASQSELLAYVNPRNPNSALTETANLFQLADHNHDNRLSLKEVIENHELFIGSKLVNTASRLHEEL